MLGCLWLSQKPTGKPSCRTNRAFYLTQPFSDFFKGERFLKELDLQPRRLFKIVLVYVAKNERHMFATAPLRQLFLYEVQSFLEGHIQIRDDDIRTRFF